MRIRRCAILWIESREVSRFELDDLLSGGAGVVSTMQWWAHAPHLAAPVHIQEQALIVLGRLSPDDWLCCDDVAATDQDAITALLDHGLLVREDASPTAASDTRLRAQHWFGAAAILHAASRWEGIDAAGEVEQAGMHAADAMRARYGAPPATLQDRGDPAAAIALPRQEPTSFDALLDARSTCRNFDTSRPLPLALFARMLERTFGARGRVQAAADFDVLKKTSPSGGALHPTEAYLVVRDVEGLARGIYHYRAGTHALQPLPLDTAALLQGAAAHERAAGKDALDYLAWIAVGGQHWFADAPALVILAPRFGRNHWKYRDHAKAYRVSILDVGHLSQTLLLGATELGLGAFITAAINESEIERAFGLTAFVDGPLAVCGFGYRAATMRRAELDPGGHVWPRPP